MAKRTRVVLVGCGGICDAWMTAVVRERIELVGLVDLLPAAAEQRRADFNATGALCGTDLKAMLNAADPEAQQRFINLIDVLVDANAPVDFFATVDLDDFLEDASQRPDAFRMASRLRLLQTAVVPKLNPET